MKSLLKTVFIMLAVFMTVSCSDLFLDVEVDAAKPEITTQPVDVAISEYEGFTLSVDARSTDGGEILYEWFRASQTDLSDAVSVGTTAVLH